ncbi:MAG: CRTAC1 family protein [Deltaproteobacteria bacterium]|nr:CRTAC1 family protein [Deltaproteobacteria bacterium]
MTYPLDVEGWKLRLWLLCAVCLVGCPVEGGPDPDDDDAVADDDDASHGDGRPASEIVVTTEAHNEIAWLPSETGFYEVTNEVSPNIAQELPPEFEVYGNRRTHMSAPTGGVVTADFDRDGFIDLFLPRTFGDNVMYWGTGDQNIWGPLADIGSLALTEMWTGSATAVDFDGDGLLDVSLTGLHEARLFRNTGERAFEDVTEAWGLRADRELGSTTAWADFDQDGDLDLFLGRYVTDIDNDDPGNDNRSAAQSSLWRNDGDSLVDVSDMLPLHGEHSAGAVLHASWHDIDGDGDLDLAHYNDFGDAYLSSRVYENQGDVFVDRSDDAQFHILTYSMGGTFRDFDGSGVPEALVTDIGSVFAFQALNPFEHVDVTQTWLSDLEIFDSSTSWSVMDLDIDGDTWSDAYITFGDFFPNVPGDQWDDEPDRVLMGTTDGGVFTGFTQQNSVLPSESWDKARGAALSDLDGNGTPDLVVGRVGQRPRVLLLQNNGTNRVVIKLVDPNRPNRYGVGATVVVETDGHRQSDTIQAGGDGSFSGQEPALYFAFGAAQTIDRMEVHWADGAVSVAEGVCANCRVRVQRQD